MHLPHMFYDSAVSNAVFVDLTQCNTAMSLVRSRVRCKINTAPSTFHSFPTQTQSSKTLSHHHAPSWLSSIQMLRLLTSHTAWSTCDLAAGRHNDGRPACEFSCSLSRSAAAVAILAKPKQGTFNDFHEHCVRCDVEGAAQNRRAVPFLRQPLWQVPSKHRQWGKSSITMVLTAYLMPSPSAGMRE